MSNMACSKNGIDKKILYGVRIKKKLPTIIDQMVIDSSKMEKAVFARKIDSLKKLAFR